MVDLTKDIPFPAKQPTRLKLLRISSEVIVNIIFARAVKDNRVAIPEVELPEGTKINAMYPDALRQCFVFVLENEEWPEVRNGKEPPDLTVMLTSREVDLKPLIHA